MNTSQCLIAGIALLGSLCFRQWGDGATTQPVVSNEEAIKGAWMLAGNSGTAIDSIADFEKLRPNLEDALAIKGVRGVSMRVTWNSIKDDLSILDYGKKFADEKKVDFTFRILAGYRVPQSIFEDGSPYHYGEESKGQKIPTPFNPDGSPNTVFEKYYDQMLSRVAEWSRKNGVRLIHCPWYGMSWAELNNHVSVRDAPGYTYDRWYDAHIRLLDIALKYAGDDLAIEFPMSGGGPTGDTVSQIVDYVWDKLGPNDERFFCQANGWGPNGYWGSPDPEMEMLKRRAFERPVLRGLQSIRQGEYDWKALFKYLYEVNATYCEIYAETLNFGGVDVMKEEIAGFAEHVEKSGAPKPPVKLKGEKPPRLTMEPAIPNDEAIAGTWPTQQVGGHKVGYGSKAEFDDIEKTVIRPALATPGVKGFSHRFPWFEIDTSMELVERGLALAREMNVEYSVRFMAGRYTPERLYEAGCRSVLVDENGSFNDSNDKQMKVPVPFMEDGSPNLVFEVEYEKFVAHLASWCRAKDVRLLHLAWYGGLWDELYHSKQIRSLKGYSYDNWLNAHLRLIDIGLRHAGRTLAIEFPFSGHGPTGDTVSQMADYVWTKIGPNNSIFLFQANGWGPNGRWGSPSPDMEALKSRAFERPIYRALQMIQPDDYPDWEGIYRRLYETNATYGEVYCPSFLKEHKNDLAEEVVKFAEHVMNNGASRPPEGGSAPASMPVTMPASHQLSDENEVRGNWAHLDVTTTNSLQNSILDVMSEDTSSKGLSIGVPWSLVKNNRFGILDLGLKKLGKKRVVVAVDVSQELTEMKGDELLSQFEDLAAHLCAWGRANGVPLVRFFTGNATDANVLNSMTAIAKGQSGRLCTAVIVSGDANRDVLSDEAIETSYFAGSEGTGAELMVRFDPIKFASF